MGTSLATTFAAITGTEGGAGAGAGPDAVEPCQTATPTPPRAAVATRKAARITSFLRMDVAFDFPSAAANIALSAASLIGVARFQVRLHDAPAIIGRSHAGDFAERYGERAGAAEAERHSDFRDRHRSLRQQTLGALDTAVRVEAVRRHTEGLLECAREMVGAETHELREGS